MSPLGENKPAPRPGAKQTRPLATLIRSPWVWLLILACLVFAAYRLFLSPAAGPAGARGKARTAVEHPLPVTAAAARKSDLDVYLNGLGTVTPVNTVTVRSQVSGQLLKVHFKEGDGVKAGELLAEIDPRPFQVQLMQAEGQLVRDESLLKNAENDLVRYKLLLSQDSIAAQQVTTQESLVQQYRGIVKTDQGQIANARLQITYSRITSPITGRVGLRLVDPGNMVQVSDATGIAVITQLQPITVVFPVPQNNLPVILARLRSGGTLPVFAYSQDSKVMLAQGTLIAVDNQIDITTGTVKLKARFDNANNELFANQFVNVAMKVDTLRGAVVVPTAAIQRGAIDTFAYVVKADNTVTVRPLKLGPTEGETVAVTSGLAPGEVVVVVGGDKLREGTKVAIATAGTAGAAVLPGQGASRPGSGKGVR